MCFRFSVSMYSLTLFESAAKVTSFFELTKFFFNDYEKYFVKR